MTVREIISGMMQISYFDHEDQTLAGMTWSGRSQEMSLSGWWILKNCVRGWPNINVEHFTNWITSGLRRLESYLTPYGTPLGAWTLVQSTTEPRPPSSLTKRR